MNLFDIITSSLAPSATTAKGSIVTVSKDGTKAYDGAGGGSKVLATYKAGKILGTVQQISKNQVIKNGSLTKDFFLIVRVKLSEPISAFTKTYTDVWVVAENLDVFAEAKATSTTNNTTTNANEVALYSTGKGVRVRYSAAIIGGISDAGNNIITSYNVGDLIGVSDKKITNGFYKVKFPTPQTKKSNGKKYSEGYVSISYCSSQEPIISVKPSQSSGQSPIQSDSTKTVNESTVKNIQSDSSSDNFFRNRYGVAVAGIAILGLLGVIGWAVNKLAKTKKKNGTDSTIGK